MFSKKNIIIGFISIILLLTCGCSVQFGVEEFVESGSLSANVNLNGQWRAVTTSCPSYNSSQYTVYESYSNHNVNSSTARMNITISGYDTFTIRISSSSESGCDYTTAYEIDSTSTIKAWISGVQSTWKDVTYSNLGGGTHTITIEYEKDGSVNNGNDRGYVCIPKSVINGTVSTPAITNYGTYYYDSRYSVVSISSSTSGSSIYYTTNGNTPTTSSYSYNSDYGYFKTSSGSSYYGILVYKGSTVKAIATKSGYSNSSVASLTLPYSSTVSTPTITNYGTYYYSSSYSVVGISSSTSGSSIYYTTNGNTPTTSSYSYNSDYGYFKTSSGSSYYGILVYKGSTVKAIATKSGYSNSSVASKYITW